MRQPIENTAPDAELRRPSERRALTERSAEWLEWFGVARLATSAIAVIVVCVGGWWLLRAPQAPPESSLPVATPSSPVATLAPPTTVTQQVSDFATPDDSKPSTLVVHVAGAVRSPGVFTLEHGSRVGDAIDRAGGTTSVADPGALNLAAPLADGVRVYVPEAGEELPIPLPTESPVDSSPTGPVDVNRATAAELERLPGVGPATAMSIIAERDRNGPFVSFADLERVPGIGPAKLSALDGLVVT